MKIQQVKSGTSSLGWADVREKRRRLEETDRAMGKIGKSAVRPHQVAVPISGV